MTLSRSVTEMEVRYEVKAKQEGISLDFYFEGVKNQSFEEKISAFLHRISEEHTFLQQLHLTVRSRNTFPHSAGIASSASSMAALAICLMGIRNRLTGASPSPGELLSEASGLARQASGSACRSVYPGYAIWGKHPDLPGTADDHAVPFPGRVHPVFGDMRDAILLVSSGKKSVSSRAGHGLMENHPFAKARYELGFRNASAMVSAIKSGDMDLFIRITEQEALTLHGLMMSSPQPFLLLHPDSLNIIHNILKFRDETKIPVCFTIDAGPNIHLLYPGDYELKVKDWIENTLSGYLENRQWIDDKMGNGPLTHIE